MARRVRGAVAELGAVAVLALGALVGPDVVASALALCPAQEVRPRRHFGEAPAEGGARGRRGQRRLLHRDGLGAAGAGGGLVFLVVRGHEHDLGCWHSRLAVGDGSNRLGLGARALALRQRHRRIGLAFPLVHLDQLDPRLDGSLRNHLLRRLHGGGAFRALRRRRGDRGEVLRRRHKLPSGHRAARGHVVHAGREVSARGRAMARERPHRHAARRRRGCNPEFPAAVHDLARAGLHRASSLPQEDHEDVVAKHPRDLCVVVYHLGGLALLPGHPLG
mmetsp:Transcript_36089/g.103881  ORF Transcript_36089/g.103881 Transcript_36089/m.103881 type:complete len:277 (-) Transcript_36089:821-1651(-)